MRKPQLTLDVLFDPAAHGAEVEGLAWRPGRPEVLGFWDGAWHLFATDGERALLARPADFGAASADAVEDVAWSADGRHLVVSLADGVVLFDVESRARRHLVRGEVRQAALAPDGRHLAFVRQADLYVVHVAADGAADEPRRLTWDGQPGVAWNGSTDWVYQEEIWGRAAVGLWWSGDGRRIAFYRFDGHDVPVHPILDVGPRHPAVEEQRYPLADDPVPAVEVRVVDVGSGAVTRVASEAGGDGDDAGYLARVAWHPDGEHLAVERLNREQTRLELRLHTIGGGHRTLAVQEHPTWINLGHEFVFLRDGRFLWSTEEEGWRHLYLYPGLDGEGERRRLTPDGWALDDLLAFSEADGWLVVRVHSTGELGAAERHLLHLSLDGETRQLTEQPGTHDAVVAADGHWIEVRGRTAEPTTQTIRHLDRDLEHRDLPRRAPSYDAARLPAAEFLTLPSPRGSLPACLIRPLASDGPCPVIMQCYGGPSSQLVADQWHAIGRTKWLQMMAERGYGVLLVDNAGSRFFGKKGEDLMHRRFGRLELESQLAGVEWLRRQSWADAERIGLWGWSAGGTTTLYCLLQSPGTWAAGAAGAPVTDWRTYDAIWIERYMDRPRDNADGYDAASPLSHAANLRDPLLLMHGLADDNVHPCNSWNLLQALIEAGVHVEQAFYPNARHSLHTFSPPAERHLYETLTAFFDRHLRHGAVGTQG